MNYVKGFDSLRAISIILVIASHMGLFAILPESDFIKTRVWMLISGTTGVQIFFTLSGFLISSILLSEKLKTGKINFKNFYARRFLRLLPPLILFYGVIGVLMHQHLIQSTKVGFMYSVLYFYNFVPKIYNTPELGLTWSPALEEQFYLIWPFVVLYTKRLATIFLIIAGVIGLCIAATFLYKKYEWMQDYNTERWFIPAVAPVLIGSAFGILNQMKLKNWNRFIQKNNLLWIGALILFLSPLFFPLSILEMSPLFQSLGIGLLLVWIAGNQQSIFVSVFDNKVLSYLGKISYGLYVYQGIFLRTGPGGNLSIQQFPQNLILTLAVAILSFHFLEKPILKLKAKFQ